MQNLEAELSKKCDELRQLFLLQQSQQNQAGSHEDTTSTTPSPPTSTTSVLRALRKTGTGTFNEEEDSSDDSSTYSTSGRQPSTLMFSKELESLKENLQDQVSHQIRNI